MTPLPLSSTGLPSREIEAGNGEATFVDQLGFSAGLRQHGVDEGAHLVIDVVTEGTYRHADLIGGEAGSAGHPNGLEEVFDENFGAAGRLNGFGRIQSAVRGRRRGGSGVGSSSQTARRSGKPSMTSAASSRAALRVICCSSR